MTSKIPALAGRLTTLEKKLAFHDELMGLVIRGVAFPNDIGNRVKLLSRLGIVENPETIETEGESADGNDET